MPSPRPGEAFDHRGVVVRVEDLPSYGLVVVAMRPRSGQTRTVGEVAVRLAATGRRVNYWHLHQEEGEIVGEIVGPRVGIPPPRLRQLSLTGDEFDRVRDGVIALRATGIVFDSVEPYAKVQGIETPDQHPVTYFINYLQSFAGGVVVIDRLDDLDPYVFPAPDRRRLAIGMRDLACEMGTLIIAVVNTTWSWDYPCAPDVGEIANWPEIEGVASFCCRHGA